MYNLCNLGILIISTFWITVCAENVIVESSHGKIAGKTFKTLLQQKEYYGFTSIPYAAPPVKDLRFLPPEPIAPWEGVLSATKEKKACVQFNSNVKKAQPMGVHGVEDCLYLDIFTPAPDTQKRAVIVFLYSEQLRTSSNKTKDYAPDFFIENDVVLVTISHRLSVFGFLSLENDLLPGNSGLRDIVAALQWIRDNVERFGGDAGRITLLGSQGGAAAVDLLIHSKAKGYFNSAILQGGTSLISMYLHENVRERAFKLGELLEITTNKDANLLQELNKASAAKLLEKELRAVPNDFFKETQRSILSFGPIVERNPDGLITEYPEHSTESINIPVMIGFNSREGLEGSQQYIREPRYLNYLRKDFPFLLPRRVDFALDPYKDSYYDATDEVKNFYFPNGITYKSLSEHVSYIGDAFVAYAVDYTAKLYSNRTSKAVYYYHFDYYSELNENNNNLMEMSRTGEAASGATAGDELCYLFKCPDLKEHYLKFSEANSEEYATQMKLIRLWTNFAKYGNPTPNEDDEILQNLEWPGYSIDKKEYLHIGKEIEVKQDLYKDRFDFWDYIIRKWKRKTEKEAKESKQKKDEL